MQKRILLFLSVLVTITSYGQRDDLLKEIRKDKLFQEHEEINYSRSLVLQPGESWDSSFTIQVDHNYIIRFLGEADSLLPFWELTYEQEDVGQWVNGVPTYTSTPQILINKDILPDNELKFISQTDQTITAHFQNRSEQTKTVVLAIAHSSSTHVLKSERKDHKRTMKVLQQQRQETLKGRELYWSSDIYNSVPDDYNSFILHLTDTTKSYRFHVIGEFANDLIGQAVMLHGEITERPFVIKGDSVIPAIEITEPTRIEIELSRPGSKKGLVSIHENPINLTQLLVTVEDPPNDSLEQMLNNRKTEAGASLSLHSPLRLKWRKNDDYSVNPQSASGSFLGQKFSGSPIGDDTEEVFHKGKLFPEIGLTAYRLFPDSFHEQLSIDWYYRPDISTIIFNESWVLEKDGEFKKELKSFTASSNAIFPIRVDGGSVIRIR